MAEVLELCDVVRETGYAVHRYLRNGFLEKVYENALAHRLSLRGVVVHPQHPLRICDEDGFVPGEYFADLFVDHQLIVEVKACSSLIDAHIAQVLGYLRAARLQHALLINFGAPIFQIKKLVL